MRIDIARAKRKCGHCKETIPKSKKLLLYWAKNDFGSKELGICKLCAEVFIKALKKDLDKEKLYLDYLLSELLK